MSDTTPRDGLELQLEHRDELFGHGGVVPAADRWVTPWVEQHHAHQNPATGSYTIPVPKDATTGRFTSEPPSEGQIVVLLDPEEDE